LAYFLAHPVGLCMYE